MKTRILNIAFSVAVLVLGMTSCGDFLDMQPTSSAIESGSVTTPADAQTIIRGVMRKMTATSTYGRNMFLYADAKGGDMIIPDIGRGADDLYRFQHSASSGSNSGFWSGNYSYIRNMNSVIDQISALEKNGATGFENVKGQAYILRAMFYFDLVRLYGLPYNYKPDSYGVPNILSAVGATVKPTRASVKENYAQIVSDLNDAVAIMPKATAKNLPSYYAAKALQARVYLYMEDYDNALAAAKEVIESGKYKPYTNDAWAASWTKQNGDESIFELGIDAVSDNGLSSLGAYLVPRKFKSVSNLMGWYYASPSFLARLGEDASDVRWAMMKEIGSQETKLTDASYKGGCLKYVGDANMSGDGKETGYAVNIKLIRLSEMYLIAAEAALHASTPDKAAAADYLNVIRKRSPALAAATAATITDDMILSERSKELYGEGHRFFDMIRMNKTITFDDELSGVAVSNRGKSIDRTFGMIVLPISKDEINANPAIASQQNEAYK